MVISYRSFVAVALYSRFFLLIHVIFFSLMTVTTIVQIATNCVSILVYTAQHWHRLKLKAVKEMICEFVSNIVI